MSTASMSFGRPIRVDFSAHLGSSCWFAHTAAAVIGLLRRLDRWLRDRAADEPKTPEEVLEWARRIEKSDPGFASDLRFAALRAMDDH